MPRTQQRKNPDHSLLSVNVIKNISCLILIIEIPAENTNLTDQSIYYFNVLSFQQRRSFKRIQDIIKGIPEIKDKFLGKQLYFKTSSSPH